MSGLPEYYILHWCEQTSHNIFRWGVIYLLPHQLEAEYVVREDRTVIFKKEMKDWERLDRLMKMDPWPGDPPSPPEFPIIVKGVYRIVIRSTY